MADSGDSNLLSFAGNALGGIIGGVASIFGSRSNRKAQQDANRANLELAKYQNQWNLEQWQRENEYNLPINQMKRLNDAGINPNMAFARGTIDNISASSPTAAPMKVEPYLGNAEDMRSFIPSIVQGLNAYEQYKQAKNQNKLSENQIDFLKADIINKRAHTEKLFQESLGISYGNYVKKELRDYNIDMFKLQMDEARADISLKNAQTDVNRLQLSYTTQQMALIAEQILKTKQETTNLKTTNELTRQYIEREKLDNALRRQGINPSDPILYRMLGRALDDPDYARELIKNLRKTGEVVVKDSAKSFFDYTNDFFKRVKRGVFTPSFLFDE